MSFQNASNWRAELPYSLNKAFNNVVWTCDEATRPLLILSQFDNVSHLANKTAFVLKPLVCAHVRIIAFAADDTKCRLPS